MQSYDLSLKELFKDRAYLFQIPNYQRSYVWEKEEISEYLKDIMYCYAQHLRGEEYDHFFGQMIFRKVQKDKSAREILEVVDGQQRLTTATLTIAALYRLILLNANIEEESVKTVLKTIKKDYLISMPDRGTNCRKLTLSERDNGILSEIATEKETRLSRDIEVECLYESQIRIYKAYQQIFEYLEALFKDCQIDAYPDKLLAFAEAVLGSISVVVIMPKTIGYSYALYQIVNDRGVLLTSAELLKARTMELLHDNDRLFDECEKAWDDILNDPGKETTRYLLWHYAAMMHQSVAKNKLHEMYEKKLFDCYGKHHITSVEQELLAEQIRLLHQSVKWCRELSKGNLPVENMHPQIYDMYSALVVGIKNEIAIPLYINMLRIEDAKIKEKVIPFVTVLISCFFFSSRTIANIHNGSISAVYNLLSELICTTPVDFEKMVAICRDKQKNKSVDSSFASKMEDSIYSKASTTTSKYLLYLLELFDGCDEITYKHILARDESMPVAFEKITTEHIAARSGADGNDLSENQRDCLGNLTLLGENKNNELDDKPYAQKRDIYRASPFAMTRRVSDNTKWEKDEYHKRQAEMIAAAKKVFII